MVTANQLSYIDNYTSPENLNFLGICLSKSCRETKAKTKIIKAQAKADAKVERAKRNTDRAIKLAEKGIDTSWAGFGKGLIGGFSTLLGSNSGSNIGSIGGLLNTGQNTDPLYEADSYKYGQIDDTPTPRNDALYIGLGVGLVIVGLIVWAIAKK
ncbi:hypothetical protein [Emticicia sp. W12TSBA100-4]|uniref:hypothetical protein n=1 Tax=Emticicia sp. W12TSBA100-4 TaxID=3160965 RepID=UPI003305CEA4